MRKPLERALPWEPPKVDQSIIVAVQALAAGTADAAQQQGVLRFIKNGLCQYRASPHFPGEDGARTSAFAAGKAWIGIQLELIENTKLGKPDPRGPPPPMPGEPEDKREVSDVA